MNNEYSNDAEKPDEEKDQNTTDQSGSKNTSEGWKVEQDPTKINIDSNIGELATGLASGTIEFLKRILSLRHGKYDYRRVVQDAKENVVFQGYSVWILICSIIVASVGLNMDSIAVVIGAMLISPLMGPIRGFGFGVAMNDFPLLMKSLKNFGVMVGISLATSIIYFLISPIDIATNELLGRTAPNFLDAVIAFFGGLAGIIASANGKNDTVINGVAIATALMPPLCTAGFGIANGEWNYFAGAAYLFLLNSLLIAFSTVVLVRYLKFPKIEYISKKIENRVQTYTIIFLILILTPSGILFYTMTKRSIFESNAERFFTEVIKETKDNLNVTYEPVFDDKKINIMVINTYIDSTTLGSWNRQKEHFDLGGYRLDLIQGDDLYSEIDRKLNESLGMAQDQNQLVNMLKEKELEMNKMNEEFGLYKRQQESKQDKVNFSSIINGIKAEYEEINDLSINRSFGVNSKKQLDTTYFIAVNFNNGVSQEEQKKVKKRISKRFCYELKECSDKDLDSVRVINY